MIELTRGGQSPIALADGDTRGFLQDGDAVMLRGWCEEPGAARMASAKAEGMVLPAGPAPADAASLVRLADQWCTFRQP